MAVKATVRPGFDRISAIRSFQSGTMSIDINRSKVTGSNAIAVPSQLLPTSTTSRSSPAAAAFTGADGSGVTLGLTYAFAQPMPAAINDVSATDTPARAHAAARRGARRSVVEATTNLVRGFVHGPRHQVRHQVHLRLGQLQQPDVAELPEVAILGKRIEPREVPELAAVAALALDDALDIFGEQGEPVVRPF